LPPYILQHRAETKHSKLGKPKRKPSWGGIVTLLKIDSEEYQLVDNLPETQPENNAEFHGSKKWHISRSSWNGVHLAVKLSKGYLL
jgi:hypothetical protein